MSIIKKIRENFQKKQASERYQNFSEEEKEKRQKTSQDIKHYLKKKNKKRVIRISLRNKRRNELSIQEFFI